MTLAINVDQVTHVLLSDGWHEVADESFTVDVYEYGQHVALGSGDNSFVGYRDGGDMVAPSTGFEFKEARTGAWISGPITSVMAVRQQRD